MDVKELKEWLKSLPEDATVHVGDTSLSFDCANDAPQLGRVVACQSSSDDGPVDYVVLLADED